MDAAADPDGGMVGAEDAGGGELVSLQWCTCGHTLGVHDVSRRLPPPCSYASVCGCKGYEASPANDDKPAPPVLTPSEVALAKVLAAWDQWDAPEGEHGPAQTMIDLSQVLIEHGFVSAGDLTEDGRALLDRARKAGVL